MSHSQNPDPDKDPGLPPSAETTEPPQAESVSLDSDSVGVEESSETPRGGGTKVVITLVVLAILVLFMVIGVVVGVL